MVQTFSLEHLPSDKQVHVALYRDVRNAAFLKQQLLAGNSDFEYAFIDATVIVSTVHVLAAVYRALTDSLQDRLKSRNVHSEIVFSLSPNNNIAESFRRFGVSDTTTFLLAVKVSTAPSITHESVQQHLSSVIEGNPVEFTDENLSYMTDMNTVRKCYKLNASSGNRARGSNAKAQKPVGEQAVDGVDQSQAREAKAVEAAILGAMALRGAG